MTRRGFTLLEMLVASMVFVVGFVAVFTLFIAGIKFRAQGDLETRSAIALRNIVEEIQLDAGTESKAPVPPSEYARSGSGFVEPRNPLLQGSADELSLIPCPSMPGMFYRVMEASDCTGGREAAGNTNASVIYLRIVVVAFPTTGDEPLSFKTLAKRLSIRVSGSEFIPELVRRGVATDNHVAILRQPSWLKYTMSN